MLQQTIRNRQPEGLWGVLLVLGVAAAAIGGSMLFTRLQVRLGSIASVLFIAYGCAIAWFLLYWFVMRFIYTANADCLRICRAYGKRERFMLDVRLNQVKSFGTLEALKARYPGARILRATRRQCPCEPLALACQTSGRLTILVIQPDDSMRAHLTNAIRARGKK